MQKEDKNINEQANLPKRLISTKNIIILILVIVFGTIGVVGLCLLAICNLYVVGGILMGVGFGLVIIMVIFFIPGTYIFFFH